MTGKTHLAFGITTGVMTAAIIDNRNLLLYTGTIIISMVGSLMPDIDHTGSKVGNKAKIVSLILNKVFGHRGLLHTPFFIFLFSFFTYCLLKINSSMFFLPLLMGFITGYAGHIFLDTLTKGGIMLLYPFKTKKISFIGMKTAGVGEDIFRSIIIVSLFSSIIFAIFKIIG